MAKMAKTHLPEEILMEIFSRLPFKSVGRCRCLSKLWLSRISTPQFISSHQARQTHQEPNLILIINPSHSLQTITTPVENDAVLSRKLELQDTWTEVVGSCNGLVLLANKEDELCLMNPLTTQKVNISDPDLALEKGERVRRHGFGYDSCTDDYKIVTLSYYDPFNGPGSKYTDTFVDVYSVKRGVWKRVGIFPYNQFVPEVATGAFVNGAIHWQAYGIASHSPCIIASFDLANEVFYEIHAPFILNSLYKNLVVRGGRLCVVPSYCKPSPDVWTMEEYGSVESWKKLTIAENEVWEKTQPLCFVGEEQVVLTTKEERLIVYNVKEGTMKGLVVDGVPAFFRDAGIFVESLISIG